MRTMKLGLCGVAVAAVAAFAASLHGTKSVGEGDPGAKAASSVVPTAPPRPEAPAVEPSTSEAKAKALEVAEAAVDAKVEPGAEAYAVLLDGTRYYWVKGATKDASGNWVPHVFHVAAQPIELDSGEPAQAGSPRSASGSPR